MASTDEEQEDKLVASGTISLDFNAPEGPGFNVGQTVVSKPGVVKVVTVTEPKWDPLSSPDWDKEVHSKEALVRIKR